MLTSTRRLLQRVALTGFAAAHLAMLVTGLVYATTGRMLRYHEQALGQSWDGVDPLLQTLYLAMCRAIGVATAIAALALLVVLSTAWRRGETWALAAVPALTLGYGLPMLAVTTWVHLRTGADSPRLALAVGIAVALGATLLSLIARPERDRHPLRRGVASAHS